MCRGSMDAHNAAGQRKTQRKLESHSREITSMHIIDSNTSEMEKNGIATKKNSGREEKYCR